MCANLALRILMVLARFPGGDAGDIGDTIAELWPACLSGSSPAAYHALYAAVSAAMAAMGIK